MYINPIPTLLLKSAVFFRSCIRVLSNKLRIYKPYFIREFNYIIIVGSVCFIPTILISAALVQPNIHFLLSYSFFIDSNLLKNLSLLLKNDFEVNPRSSINIRAKLTSASSTSISIS